MVNKSLRMERLLKDGFSMGSGGKGRRKEKDRIRGRLDTKKDTTTIPQQRCRKLVGYFSHSE
jgi:hypothetical protein